MTRSAIDYGHVPAHHAPATDRPIRSAADGTMPALESIRD
ncbi:hypothetical protein STTU_0983 [Streptomyces sp. Tu6071]|nr:hypothetical protein STTU_0983 [Streptomyces sp. Tu6071]